MKFKKAATQSHATKDNAQHVATLPVPKVSTCSTCVCWFLFAPSFFVSWWAAIWDNCSTEIWWCAVVVATGKHRSWACWKYFFAVGHHTLRGSDFTPPTWNYLSSDSWLLKGNTISAAIGLIFPPLLLKLKEKENFSFHEPLAGAQTHACKCAVNAERGPAPATVHAWLLNSLPEGSSAPLVRLCQVFGEGEGGRLVLLPSKEARLDCRRWAAWGKKIYSWQLVWSTDSTPSLKQKQQSAGSEMYAISKNEKVVK